MTGGEPLLHPDFEEIIEFCAPRFSPLGILTNGNVGHRSDREETGSIQRTRSSGNVSLDSSKAHLHDEARGVAGSWERTLRGIRLLADQGILVRAAMCVYENTVDDIEETLKLARSAGARLFSHNTVSPWGRGKKINWDVSRVKQNKLLKEFDKIRQEKYADMMAFIPQSRLDEIEEQGCGAGFTSFVLGAAGEIRPCVILEESYLTFGNIFHQSMEEITISENARRWRTVQLPTEEVCGDCKYQSYCKYCIAKGIMLSDDFEGGCRWARHYGVIDWISSPNSNTPLQN